MIEGVGYKEYRQINRIMYRGTRAFTLVLEFGWLNLGCWASSLSKEQLKQRAGLS